MNQTLEQTRQFWNATPCGGQSDVEARLRHRYTMEPWLPEVLEEVARTQTSVVEVGCGQGTDGLLLCSLLAPGGRYHGIDYSEASVAAARTARHEFTHAINVEPEFSQGNAEALPFATGTVPFLYSMGVLHHTADTQRAVDEVWRVLAPGGQTCIILYACASPKVMLAKALRSLQWLVDRMTGRERIFYHLLLDRHRGEDAVLGTMLLECFGVPVMRCYSKECIHRLFARFDTIQVERRGYNLPWLHRDPSARTPLLGYLWQVRARKP